MRNKPLYLILFPYLALVIAASFPLQIHMIYDIPLTSIKRVFSMLTPLNLLTMSVMVLTAVLTFRMSKLVYKIIPPLLLITFANNAIVGLYGTDYTLFQVALSFILLGLSLKPFYSKEIRAVITEPKLRWWLTPTRYKIEKPLKLHSELLDISSETFNISKTGLFAKVNEAHYLEQLDIDQIVNLELLQDKPITLKARVVRKSQGDEKLPTGLGLEFIKDDFHKKDFIPWLRQTVT